ncbi:prepilin-type N-terminal cleavage/methylation domain-containing protein [Rossellomorea vietnamensis]|uniref:Prepilin-type N-terminal cleavage/methylation domain-containing protein n=1 Tax=Rossellomorea vietnamensis TaxID=218284 RepID=A0A5D4P1P2_9BACI|nr:prepilin-type N-terminal cleavage/methylation domain-containing protein [Rossellomorea vietnamensis]
MDIVKLNQKGLTLVELLAVIVIMGIIGMIAVLAIGQIIEKSKHQAFVANAHTLKDAATLYAKESLLHDNELTEISYKTLYENNMIEKIRDPFTNKTLDPGTNKSFVMVTKETIESICFIGETKKLCGIDGEDYTPVLMKDINEDLISSN